MALLKRDIAASYEPGQPNYSAYLALQSIAIS